MANVLNILRTSSLPLSIDGADARPRKPSEQCARPRDKDGCKMWETQGQGRMQNVRGPGTRTDAKCARPRDKDGCKMCESQGQGRMQNVRDPATRTDAKCARPSDKDGCKMCETQGQGRMQNVREPGTRTDAKCARARDKDGCKMCETQGQAQMQAGMRVQSPAAWECSRARPKELAGATPGKPWQPTAKPPLHMHPNSLGGALSVGQEAGLRGDTHTRAVAPERQFAAPANTLRCCRPDRAAVMVESASCFSLGADHLSRCRAAYSPNSRGPTKPATIYKSYKAPTPHKAGIAHTTHKALVG
eukprot:364331-Chlamydomonas_euryale.AAC.10